MILNLLFGAVSAVFVGMGISALMQLRWARRLPELVESQKVGMNERILCSIVLAARNEEGRVEKTIRTLLQQSGATLEIIVVDDRSSDRTGEILTRLAEEDARVRVVRVGTLPPGWLGKCHACHAGASMARGE